MSDTEKSPDRTPGRRRLATASLWAGGGFAIRQIIRLGGNLVFSRLLFPEAFGLMAIVNAFWVGLVMFSDFGIQPSIVQSDRGDEPRFLDTAWTLQIIRGGILFVIAAAAAVPLAAIYEAPELTGMLLLTSLAVVLNGFESTSLPRLQRNLDIGRFEMIEIAAQVAAVVAILIWLLIEPSVWALAFAGVVQAIVTLVLSHVHSDRRDGFAWDRSAVNEIFGFGGWILLSTMVTFMAEQADRLIVGRLSTLSDLGVYSIAAMIAALPSVAIGRIGTLVVFPALSRGREAGRNMNEIYQQVRRPVIAAGGLVVAGLLAAGEPLIGFLYDDRYSEAGWMLQLLALGAWFRVLQAPARSALLALGKTRWMPALSTAKMISVVVGLPIGFSAAGIGGGIIALVAGDAISWLVAAYAVQRQGLRGLGGDVAFTVAILIAGALGLYAGTVWDESGSFLATLISGTASVLAFAPVALWMLIRSGMIKKGDWSIGKPGDS